MARHHPRCQCTSCDNERHTVDKLDKLGMRVFTVLMAILTAMIVTLIRTWS